MKSKILERKNLWQAFEVIVELLLLGQFMFLLLLLIRFSTQKRLPKVFSTSFLIFIQLLLQVVLCYFDFKVELEVFLLFQTDVPWLVELFAPKVEPALGVSEN